MDGQSTNAPLKSTDSRGVPEEPFVLDRTENPHPKMLAGALDARADAASVHFDPWDPATSYWTSGSRGSVGTLSCRIERSRRRPYRSTRRQRVADQKPRASTPPLGDYNGASGRPYPRPAYWMIIVTVNHAR